MSCKVTLMKSKSENTELQTIIIQEVPLVFIQQYYKIKCFILHLCLLNDGLQHLVVKEVLSRRGLITIRTVFGFFQEQLNRQRPPSLASDAHAVILFNKVKYDGYHSAQKRASVVFPSSFLRGNKLFVNYCCSNQPHLHFAFIAHQHTKPAEHG